MAQRYRTLTFILRSHSSPPTLQLNAKVNRLKENSATLKSALSDLQHAIEEEKMERVMTARLIGTLAKAPKTHVYFDLQPERQAALARHAELQLRIANLDREREQYGASDPVQINLKRRAVVLAHEAASRHTGETFLHTAMIELH